MHAHHCQQGASSAKQRRSNNSADIVEPVDKLSDVCAHVRTDGAENDQFQRYHDKQDNHGCKQYLQEIRNQIVDLFVDQTQNPDGEYDRNDG